MADFRKWILVLAAVAIIALPAMAATTCSPAATISTNTSPIVRANGETELVGEIDIDIDHTTVVGAPCSFSSSAYLTINLTFPVAVTNVLTNATTGAVDAVLTNTASTNSFNNIAVLNGANGLTFTLPSTEPLSSAGGTADTTLQITNIRLDASQQGSGALTLQKYSAAVINGAISQGYPLTISAQGALSLAYLFASDTVSTSAAPVLQQCASAAARPLPHRLRALTLT